MLYLCDNVFELIIRLGIQRVSLAIIPGGDHREKKRESESCAGMDRF